MIKKYAEGYYQNNNNKSMKEKDITHLYNRSPLGANFLQIQSGTNFSRSSICSSTSPMKRQEGFDYISTYQYQKKMGGKKN